MKKKIITIFIVLVIVFTLNTVQAVAILNLQITLPEDLKQTNTLSQGNICLHATNEAKDESVMVVQLENEVTKQVGNLNQLEEGKFKTFLEKYNEAKQQEKQTILKQETYVKDNMLFIDTIFEQTSNDRKLQTEEYYTIVEGKTVIVSASFLNKDVDTLKVRQMIDSIQISLEESKVQNSTYLWVMLVLLILVVTVYVIKEKRNKIELEQSEKKRLLQRVMKYMSKLDYSKWKGIFVLFVITIVMNMINLLFGMIQIVTQSGWMMQYPFISKVYVIVAILQNAIQLIGLIYISYRLTKREAATRKKIQNTLMGMLIGVSVLMIARCIIQAIVGGINQDFIQYIAKEASVFAKSIIYLLIWYCYFQNSIRVSVYYGEKSLEQIVMEPKKGYQTSVIHKKIKEFKIIEYFEKQKAVDYASGIYMNQLPKEYARSASLSNLNSKKIIRLKRAKYYLSQKDLENPKTENRQMLKIVGGMIVVYLLVIAILSTF